MCLLAHLGMLEAMNILEDIAAGGVYVSHVAKDEDVLTGRFLLDKQL